MKGRRVVLAVLAVVAVGCGGDSRQPAARDSPTATAAPAVAEDTVCGQVGTGGREISFRTRDGVRLAGAVFGSGPTGAVLIHEYPLNYCGWLKYGRYLSRHGVRVLMFDLRCFGLSECPHGRGHPVTDVEASVAELRRRGARRVALVGASMGGSVAVVAAARLRVDAVVSLSGERDTTGLTPGVVAKAGAAASRVIAPALFVVARRDQYVSPAETRAMARRARRARAIVLPAIAGHGWAMLDGLTAEWSPLARTVARFIRQHAR